MPLTAGTRLGSYEVIEAIGAGGMGEVYRARDTKLDRDVAIKPDGKRFAIIKPNDAATAAEYRVVLNWADEMKARVGPRK